LWGVARHVFQWKKRKRMSKRFFRSHDPENWDGNRKCQRLSPIQSKILYFMDICGISLCKHKGRNNVLKDGIEDSEFGSTQVFFTSVESFVSGIKFRTQVWNFIQSSKCKQSKQLQARVQVFQHGFETYHRCLNKNFRLWWRHDDVMMTSFLISSGRYTTDVYGFLHRLECCCIAKTQNHSTQKVRHTPEHIAIKA
jgi:hypothetical protein